jgi:MFS family permease
MKDHDPDHRIQPLASLDSESTPRMGETDPPLLDNPEQPGKWNLKRPYAGMLFGAFAGLIAGSTAGAASCGLAGLSGSFWQIVLVGAVAGPLGGALIGIKERRARGNLVRPDIATIICVIYGLVPALLLVLGGIGLVKGKFTGYLFLGVVSAGPMLGLLVGGILDRAYEATFKKSWGTALGSSCAALAVCTAMVLIFARATSPPDPEEVVPKVKRLILREWKKKPELRGATIQEITLVHNGGKEYTGFIMATIRGQAERFSLKVILEEDGILELILEPMQE